MLQFDFALQIKHYKLCFVARDVNTVVPTFGYIAYASNLLNAKNGTTGNDAILQWCHFLHLVGLKHMRYIKVSTTAIHDAFKIILIL